MSKTLEDNEINKIIISLDSHFDEIKESHMKAAYDFVVERLKTGDTISQPQYKFLCWLSCNNNDLFPSPVNEPAIPEIVEMSFEDFSSRLCFNVHRSLLFVKLKDYLKDKNGLFNCQHIDLLVGGSFVDLNKEHPSDIDCGILLKRDIIDTYTAACDNYTRDFQGEEIDANFLYEDYTFKEYRAFVWVTMLGNIPAIKDSENTYSIKNNFFEVRSVYKVRFEFDVSN